MKLKINVRLGGITPQLVLAALIVSSVYERHGAEATLTSVSDGKHGLNTKHGGPTNPVGNAFDVRTKDYQGDKKALVKELQAALGPMFDVILEDLGKANEHIHVEYDPS